MNKNRKIGLGVMATALALGLVVAPTTMHATENTSVPSLEQNTSEEENAPTITLSVIPGVKLQNGDSKNTAKIYVPENFSLVIDDLLTAKDKDGNPISVAAQFITDEVKPDNPLIQVVRIFTVDDDGLKTEGVATIEIVDSANMPTNGVDKLTFKGKMEKPSTPDSPQAPNTKPEIKFADDIVNDIELGKELDLMKGVTAEDKEDGDLTDKITVEGTLNNKVAGTYKIVYNVEDKDGNKSAVVREITVKELEEGEIVGTEPVFEGVDEDLLIALNGEPDYLEGVKATDEEDGDLTDKIDVDASQVDLSKEGELIYRVADSDGNLTTAIRKAIVTQVGGLGEESSNPNALPKTGAIAGVSVGGLGIAGIAGAILRRRK